MTIMHVFVQVCLFLLFGIKVYFMHSYIIFILLYCLKTIFSPTSYVITEVLQALRKSHHQELYSKTDALLLNTFSRGARECKHCLRTFMYQRTEKHTLKIHKNIISSFRLLLTQSRSECF